MTIKELEQFCHELGFEGKIGTCVKNALYAHIPDNLYSCPTLIYCPPEQKYVYISPALKICKTAELGYTPNYMIKRKIYYCESVPRERGEFGNMTKDYPSYKLSDTDAVKDALLKLKRKWKEEMNRLKVKEISKDFV